MSEIQLAAKDALMVQDAINLSGIVRTLCGHMEVIRDHAKGGTDAVNTHPVVQLFVAKLVELAGLGLSDPEAYGKAYKACQELAEP